MRLTAPLLSRTSHCPLSASRVELHGITWPTCHCSSLKHLKRCAPTMHSTAVWILIRHTKLLRKCCARMALCLKSKVDFLGPQASGFVGCVGGRSASVGPPHNLPAADRPIIQSRMQGQMKEYMRKMYDMPGIVNDAFKTQTYKKEPSHGLESIISLISTLPTLHSFLRL